MPGRSFGARAAVLLFAGALLLTACGGNKPAGKGGAKGRVIQAGMNDSKDKTIAVLAFLPGEATVAVGVKVTWNFAGPEPHTVTFVPAGKRRPLPSDADATKAIPATGPYDGTVKVSSGLLGSPSAGRFSMTFGKAGTYTYYCAIHPNHQGTITIVAAGQKVDTQAELRVRARSEADTYLAEGRAAKRKLVDTAPRRVRGANGSTTWYVEMGVGTKHTTVLAFAPTPAKIKRGDTVVFVNNSNAPHTASFAGKTTLPSNPESKEATKASGRSPLTLNATLYFNTGWLPPNVPGSGPPLAARSFTFRVPRAGTYAYVCILHLPSAMIGTIVAT